MKQRRPLTCITAEDKAHIVEDRTDTGADETYFQGHGEVYIFENFVRRLQWNRFSVASNAALEARPLGHKHKKLEERWPRGPFIKYHWIGQSTVISLVCESYDSSARSQQLNNVSLRQHTSHHLWSQHLPRSRHPDIYTSILMFYFPKWCTGDKNNHQLLFWLMETHYLRKTYWLLPKTVSLPRRSTPRPWQHSQNP